MAQHIAWEQDEQLAGERTEFNRCKEEVTRQLRSLASERDFWRRMFYILAGGIVFSAFLGLLRKLLGW